MPTQKFSFYMQTQRTLQNGIHHNTLFSQTHTKSMEKPSRQTGQSQAGIAGAQPIREKWLHQDAFLHSILRIWVQKHWDTN